MNPSPSPRPASPSPAWRRGNRPAHLIVAGALLAIALVAAAVVLGRAPGPPPVESSSAVERTMGYGDARDPTSFQPVAVGQLGAQQIVVAGGGKLLGETFELYRWDLATGASIGQPLTGHTDYIAALTIAHIDDRPIIVSGGYDGEVRRWDLATGTPVGQPIAVRSRDDEGHVPAPCSLAAAQLDGRSLIVVADTNRDVRVWDLASGAPLGQRIAADAVVVAATQLDGRPVVLTGGRDGVVRMWDPTTGVPVGRPLSLDTGTVDVPAENRLDPRHVSSVAVALLHGRPVIVAAGWRLVDGDADAIVRVGHGHRRTGRSTARHRRRDRFDGGDGVPWSAGRRRRWLRRVAGVRRGHRCAPRSIAGRSRPGFRRVGDSAARQPAGDRLRQHLRDQDLGPRHPVQLDVRGGAPSAPAHCMGPCPGVVRRRPAIAGPRLGSTRPGRGITEGPARRRCRSAS